MKAIKQRALPLTTIYTLTDKKYIPLENGIGLCCENCGKLIANIATVTNTEGNSFYIGFDCLETLLINNGLLSNTQDYEKVKKMIPSVIRFAKSIKERMKAHSHLNITGLNFESPKYTSDWFTFYWLQNNQQKSRDNDNVKLKNVDFDFLIDTIKNIFPKLEITTK